VEHNLTNFYKDTDTKQNRGRVNYIYQLFDRSYLHSNVKVILPNNAKATKPATQLSPQSTRRWSTRQGIPAAASKA
jgi:predicted transcriptional regulator